MPITVSMTSAGIRHAPDLIVERASLCPAHSCMRQPHEPCSYEERGTMRAFAIDAFSTPGSVHDLPGPTIRPDELLVRVHAAGVNPTDWKIRDRQMPVSAPQFPLVLGQDLAGIVEQVGTNVTGWTIGDEVFGIVRQVGTFAEEVAVTTSAALARKPRTLDFVHAAALPTPALTALASLDAVALQEGETLLVVGATGGVGRYAVQLAARRGIHVIGTGRSRE